ncbi:hypothetical protein U8Y98_27530 [Priestia megaterium]|uniref:hypothetical protein n=1 Tax=Priestia megaterium TaxID=1404 RepID=UPI002FDFFDCF
MPPKGFKGKKNQVGNNCCMIFNKIFNVFKENNNQEIRFFIGQKEYLVNNINNFDFVQCIVNANDLSNNVVPFNCNELANVDPQSIEPN